MDWAAGDKCNDTCERSGSVMLSIKERSVGLS